MPTQAAVTEHSHVSALINQVMEASAASYRQTGEDVLVSKDDSKDSRSILMGALRRYEEIRISPRFTKSDLARFRRLQGMFDLWVLLPIESIGEAHGRLRGVVDRLQPWWIEEGIVRFGTPRIP